MADRSHAPIPNEDLTLDAIPASVAERSIYCFAVTFDGYGYHSLARQVANCLLVGQFRLERWLAEGALPLTVTELRDALFYLQRSDHHSGGDDLQSDYAAALLEALRGKVGAGDVEELPAYEELPVGYDLEDRLGRLDELGTRGGELLFAGERGGSFYAATGQASADGVLRLWRFTALLSDGSSSSAAGLGSRTANPCALEHLG